jgi:hypothetical protein
MGKEKAKPRRVFKSGNFFQNQLDSYKKKKMKEPKQSITKES